MSQRLLDIYNPKAAGAGTGRKECRMRAAELAALDRSQRNALVHQMSSGVLNPRDRIHLWETVFGIQLPSRASHPLIRVIAERTGLTVDDVAAEQCRRSVHSQ